MTFFSPTTCGFYAAELKENFVASGTWPADAVEISAAEYDEFKSPPPSGKMLGAADGKPAWVDIPAPTQEERISVAEQQKQQLRIMADSEISWRQDAVDAGIATEEETAALGDWKKYRVLLMRVDTVKPDWPTLPGEQAS
ncbi:tail fiber assembly protein [Citrobacter freundii]|nr:tail fiber assembly protein [Citrobacter freundii]EHP6101748.1 tail fiber assembly protein [Escherichia coli]ELM6416073.1 tail fiber assembly protein [Escherichia coli]QMR45490.1 tail fiber assembly protein [Citrobacter freundii]